MNSHPTRFEELELRLLNLEKQNRRLKQLGATLLILVTSLIVMGQAPSKKTVEANEFILRDDSGNIRARLFVSPKQTNKMTIPGLAEPVPVTLKPRPTLALYDEKGETSGFLDDDEVNFLKSHISLGGGVLTIGDGTNGAVISSYSMGLFDEQGFEATLGRRAMVVPRTG